MFKREDILFAGKTEEEKTLLTKCFHKFFYEVLPDLQKISTADGFINRFGRSIGSLGIERASEVTRELFEDGTLKMVVEDEDNFLVYHSNKREATLVYDSNWSLDLQ